MKIMKKNDGDIVWSGSYEELLVEHDRWLGISSDRRLAERRLKEIEGITMAKTGKDITMRFLISGNVGIWNGYCRECDFSTIEMKSFLDAADQASLHNLESGHEVVVAGNAGDDIEKIVDLLGTRIADACEQCKVVDDNWYFTFGLCNECR